MIEQAALARDMQLTTLKSGKWISHSLKKMAKAVAAVQPMMAPLLVLFSNCGFNGDVLDALTYHEDVLLILAQSCSR